MRILWVNPNFLHPTTKGGQIRTLGILRELHREHEIHYVAYQEAGSGEGPAKAPEYSSYHYPVPSQVASKASARFYLELVRGLADPMPVAIRRFATPALRRTVAELRQKVGFDVLVADFLASVPAFDDLSQAVLFQHNVESDIWRRRAAQAASLPQRLYLGGQFRRMFQYEREACRQARKIIAVSELDARTMHDLYGVSGVGWTDTGVDVDYFTPPGNPAPAAGPGEMVFVGSMDWMPNVDGVLWFMREVWPRIAAARPGTTLAIVGRQPPPEILALAADPSVRVTGTVPDVRPWLWQSRLSIVPLRIGGGTRLKIYEAMAARAPVVSTAIGAEGLAGEAGREILIADEPEAFAAACLRLLDGKEGRDGIAEAAGRMVDGRFRWGHVAQDFARLLEAWRIRR
jgi:glycosyltransferase involved in cell wall biosynthesis